MNARIKNLFGFIFIMMLSLGMLSVPSFAQNYSSHNYKSYYTNQIKTNDAIVGVIKSALQKLKKENYKNNPNVKSIVKDAAYQLSRRIKWRKKAVLFAKKADWKDAYGDAVMEWQLLVKALSKINVAKNM